jgi:hypothetical protein
MSGEDKIGLLTLYADKMKIDPQILLGLYMVMGDWVFLMIYMLAGKHVVFPTEPMLKTCAKSLARCKVIKVSGPVKKGDILDGNRIVMGDPLKIEGEFLILVKEPKSKVQGEMDERERRFEEFRWAARDESADESAR